MTTGPFPAVILAGGLARRMGGGDKALLPLGEGVLLDHILARLGPQSRPIALNANGEAGRFATFGLAVLGDSVAGFAGPLAGVLAAMDWAADLGQSHVLTVAGDTPFFPRDLGTRLAAQGRPDHPCLAASQGDDGTPELQPLFGLWPVALRGVLRSDLVRGVRKVRQWTTAQNATHVLFPDGGFDFFNINTPNDLYLAELHLGQPGAQR